MSCKINNNENGSMKYIISNKSMNIHGHLKSPNLNRYCKRGPQNLPKTQYFENYF